MNPRQPKVSVAVYLGGLTSQASTTQERNIFGQVRPHIAGEEEPVGSSSARVSKAMHMLKENMSEALGNQRMENGSGDEAEERSVTNHVGEDAKSSRSHESLYLRTQHLLLSKVKGRKGRVDGEQNGSQRWGRQGRWPRESIGNNIGHPSSVVNGEMEFGNESQLLLLAARLRNRLTDGGVNSLELTVKCGITLLRRSEFSGGKGKTLPHSMNLLLDAKMTVGERDGSSGVRMKKESGRGQSRLDLLKSRLHGWCPGEKPRITSQGISERLENGSGGGKNDETEKALEILERGWERIIANGINKIREGGDASDGDRVAQEGERQLCKDTFGQVDQKTGR